MDCVKTHSWVRKHPIGGGHYAQVDMVCCGETCTFAMKIQELRVEEDPTYSFDREVHIGQIASDLGIGPKIYDCWKTKRRGYIVMENLVRLDSELLTNVYVQKEIIDKIKKMHEAGIYHRDLHLDNVMTNVEGEIKIIDYGMASMKGTDDYNADMYNVSRLKVPDFVLKSRDPKVYSLEYSDISDSLESYGIKSFELIDGYEIAVEGNHEDLLGTIIKIGGIDYTMFLTKWKSSYPESYLKYVER